MNLVAVQAPPDGCSATSTAERTLDNWTWTATTFQVGG